MIVNHHVKISKPLCNVQIVGAYIVEDDSHEVWYFKDNKLVHRTISGLQNQTQAETFQIQQGILIDKHSYKGGTGITSGDAEITTLTAGHPSSINATSTVNLISINGNCIISMG